MTRTYTASSTAAVAVGEEVVVVDAIGNALKVQAVAVGQAGSREA
jgi:membrane-bound ClpP family serine protease